MDKDNNKSNKRFLFMVLSFCLILIFLVLIGFKKFLNKGEKVIEKEKHGGNVTLNYSSSFKGISIINAIPTSDSVGMTSTDEEQIFDFSIKVDLDKANSVEYEIYVSKKKNDSSIVDDDIRIYLEKEKSGTYTKLIDPTNFKSMKKNPKLEVKEESMLLTKVEKEKSGTDNYRLKMWLADTSLIQNGSYSIEVNVVGKAK